MVMEDKLLKIVYDYSKSNKYLDYDAIEEIISIIVSNYKLEDYVKDVHLSYKSSNNNLNKHAREVMSYNFQFKEIILNVDGLTYFLSNNNYSGSTALFKTNFTLLQFILHEIEHSRHYKIMDFSDDDLSKLLKIIYGLSLDSFEKTSSIVDKLSDEGYNFSEIFNFFEAKRKRYEKFYDLNPVERIAEIDSNKSILNIMKDEKNILKDIYIYFYYNYLYNYLRGYKYKNGLLVAPTKEYILKMDNKKIDLLNEINVGYSVQDRMYMGFPITNMEYEEKKLILKNVGKNMY